MAEKWQKKWLVDVVKPIFKNKDDPFLPENYKLITFLKLLG